MKKIVSAIFLVIVSLVTIQVNAQQCGVKCGVERWRVKTLTDSTVGNIDPDEIAKSIQWLRTRKAPSKLPGTSG